jgi:hypothetical protein
MFRWTTSSVCAPAAALMLALAVPATSQAATSRYVGIYYTVRTGADSLQDITLRLDASGGARLTTRYPGYTKTAAGVIVYPFVETGNWVQDKDGSIDVTFTKGGQLIDGAMSKPQEENRRIGLNLVDNVMTSIRDENHDYGSQGLLFRKADCDTK